MIYFTELNLQLFADGGGEGGGGAPAGVDNAVDAGQQRLLELGVPASKLRKRAQKQTSALPEGAVTTAPAQKAETAQNEQAAAAEETETPQNTRMTWDEIMADPEYNSQMQSVIKARLKKSQAAQDNLTKLAPAIEILARQYKLDPENLDYDALAQAISDDHTFYEDKAMELGVSVDTAMKIEKSQRETEKRQREEARTLQEQSFQRHIQSLEQQGEALKKTFPKFDLRRELENPAFARMTSPNVGLSVEDAYYAVHRKEIQAASMQITAQKTAQMISNSIQAGQKRPVENGTSGQAASVTSFDYRTASREQREALKRRIREAAARGEKLYPGK